MSGIFGALTGMLNKKLLFAVGNEALRFAFSGYLKSIVDTDAKLSLLAQRIAEMEGVDWLKLQKGQRAIRIDAARKVCVAINSLLFSTLSNDNS